LSGRYITEQANPGKSIKILEMAMNKPINNFITAESVQKVIEGTLGVKVTQAQGAESKLLLNLEDQIHERMINQKRAVSVVSSALRRSRAGVSNPKRPVGSFLFLGPTGVGKTELAKSLAAIYYGGEANMTRLDMSEYQQPEDVKRLLEVGSSFLTDLRQKPFSVVLLDEIEKAHPNMLNLLLQMLDEGNLTDNQGRTVSFKDTIIIATSNAGADEIRKHIEAGEDLESFEVQFTDQLINSGKFKPELLNRFDEIVLFRPLNEQELAQVVSLLIADVNKTISNQNIDVSLTPEAVALLVKQGYDPRLGARPMRRMVQRKVEDLIAGRILNNQAHAGDHIILDVNDIS
jgi:ATP-dependent Clp protease ATP-binding subunit ClpC